MVVSFLKFYSLLSLEWMPLMGLLCNGVYIPMSPKLSFGWLGHADCSLTALVISRSCGQPMLLVQFIQYLLSLVYFITGSAGHFCKQHKLLSFF